MFMHTQLRAPDVTKVRMQRFFCVKKLAGRRKPGFPVTAIFWSLVAQQVLR